MRVRGQVTVELMIIIAVLLVILLVSVNIFGTQAGTANSRQTLLELRQNQEKVLELVYQASNSPIGTTVVAFIPVSQADQNFFIAGKNLYGSSAEFDLISALPIAGIDNNSFSSGVFIRVTRNARGITVSPIAAAEIVPEGDGKDGGDGDIGDGDEGRG